MRELTEEDFLKDVANHRMVVLRNEGAVGRHVRFKRPHTGCMSFDLITWPGHLCYTGDMGTYVFSRVMDMFEFFRAPKDKGLSINPSYWAEKCLASDRDGVSIFSPELFTKSVMRWLYDYIKAHELPPDKAAELTEEVEQSILPVAENDGGYAAYDAVYDFSWYDGDRRHLNIFQDFCEISCDEFTYRYRWCCYAMVWGIAVFDNWVREVAP